MTPPQGSPAAVIERLADVIEGRREADPERSYVARLLRRGKGEMARKVGEEAVELVVAAAAGDRAGVVAESADLIFHMMVLWADAGVPPAEVFAELERREGTSGIDEKRRRSEP